MKRITNESLFELKNVSQPLVVGDYAFYLETKMMQEENEYVSSIYRIHLETKERTHFGDTGSSNSRMKLSPDKKLLTYLSNNTKDKKMQLFAIPLAGGAANQLTTEKNGVSNYLWVEDSQTIYYQTFVEEEAEEETDKKEEALPTKSVFTKLKYKAEGSGNLAENKLFQIKKISIADLNQPAEAELIIEKDRALGLSYIAKDESYLMYFDRFDPENEWLYGGTMFRYDFATKEAKNLTEAIPNGIFSFALAASDEEYFVFNGNDFAYKFVTNNELFLYDVKNDSLKSLTADLDFSVGDSLVADFQQNTGGADVWWLEDGATFLFKVTEHGKITFYEGNVQGEIKKIWDEKLHITGFDLTADQNKAVISYSDLTTPSKLALMHLKTGAIVDLYNPNTSFMGEHQVTQPEGFWFKSVKDWDVQGWYVPPIEKTEKHPAILYIHGGPQVSYGETFFHEMQALAAAGYGVIMLNPRGGSGYGQEFVASILNNYGDEDYQDLMNGLDYVLEQYPAIDADSLYVAGGSYGGFMTNWIVTQTDRFRAAVTQRSISNWLSFYGTSDIGPSFVEFQLGRDLTQADELWEMSPVAHAENAKTPLLIIHGEEDLRCPLEQAEQMYVAMKKYEVNTQLVVFPKSNHGLSREGLPNLRIERLEEIANWFEKF